MSNDARRDVASDHGPRPERVPDGGCDPERSLVEAPVDLLQGAAGAFAGAAEPVYSAIWRSPDGQRLDFTPGLLPGAPKYVIADGLTVIDDTLLAIGFTTRGGGDAGIWRSVDGLDWTLLRPRCPCTRRRTVVVQRGRGLAGRRPNVADRRRRVRRRHTYRIDLVVRPGRPDRRTRRRATTRPDRRQGKELPTGHAPPRPLPCRTSAAPDQVLDPPRKVGSALVVASTCTATARTAGGPTGPTEQHRFSCRMTTATDGRSSTSRLGPGEENLWP